MKHHISNPWTQKPSIVVTIQPEEASRLLVAMEACMVAAEGTTACELDAYRQMVHTLRSALQTDRPRGVAGPGRGAVR
jgi:hypothetical protein